MAQAQAYSMRSEGSQKASTAKPQPNTFSAASLDGTTTIAGMSGINTLPTRLDSMEKDVDFWFEDGNLVLAAGNTLFRLYKGILASRSPVFHAMVSSASPVEEEMLDGCPIVYLADTSQELRHFLRALIPGPSIAPVSRVTSHDDKLTPDALLAVARLAHKYEVDGLLRQTLDSLHHHYTRNFDVWVPSRMPCFRTSVPRFYAIGVVNLARLTGSHSMLPTALYECCALRGAVIRGWKRDDGVVERLSDDDIERCIDGAQTLSFAVVQATARMLDCTPCAECCQPEQCETGIQETAERLRRNSAITRGDLAFLRWSFCLGMGLDDKCVAMLKARDKAERRKIWEQLPTIFKITEVERWNCIDD